MKDKLEELLKLKIEAIEVLEYCRDKVMNNPMSMQHYSAMQEAGRSADNYVLEYYREQTRRRK